MRSWAILGPHCTRVRWFGLQDCKRQDPGRPHGQRLAHVDRSPSRQTRQFTRSAGAARTNAKRQKMRS